MKSILLTFIDQLHALRFQFVLESEATFSLSLPCRSWWSDFLSLTNIKINYRYHFLQQK